MVNSVSSKIQQYIPYTSDLVVTFNVLGNIRSQVVVHATTPKLVMTWVPLANPPWGWVKQEGGPRVFGYNFGHRKRRSKSVLVKFWPQEKEIQEQFWYNFGHRKGRSMSVLVIILAIGKGDPIVKNPTSCITLNVDKFTWRVLSCRIGMLELN